MTETHDYERRREIAQWYDDASGWHREINETTPKAVREAMGKLIRCARQMMLRHADEVLAACAEVEQINADRDSLLRIIGDSFMNLHIPHSAMAFDGRNLTPHAEESARASEIYRTERDAAREHMGVVQSALDAAHLEQVEDELGGLRAEIRRLDGIIDDIEERAWKALGEPEGTYDSTNVQRLCAEVVRLRSRVAVLERVRNEAEWVRKAYELDDNDDQGATDLCAALDAAKETDQ